MGGLSGGGSYVVIEMSGISSNVENHRKHSAANALNYLSVIDVPLFL